MKRALVMLLVVGLIAGIACMTVLPARSFAAEDVAPEYSIFYSPPERLDALFWAIVDCYPVRDLAEAKERFLAAGGAEWDHWQNGWTADIGEMGLQPDEEKLAALETEFGDMPEYWQARCFFELVQTRQRNVAFLERACEVAPDDPAGKYFLADAKRELAESSLEDAEDPFAEQLKRREAMRDAAEVMLRCAEREPQNAFYFYEAAFIIRKLGEYERVAELLRLGNAAPVNENVQLFPESYIVRNLREIRAQDDGSGKFRLLSFALINTLLPDYVQRREMIKEYKVVLLLSADTELLNVLHLFSCRLGEQRYARLIDQLVAMVFVGMVNEMAGEIGAVATDGDTLRCYTAIHSGRGQIRGLASSSNTWLAFLRDEGVTSGVPRIADPFNPRPEEMWESYAGWWEDAILNGLYISPEIAKIFWKLEGYKYHVDGTILRGSPKSLRPLPPVSSATPTIVQ